MQRWRTDRPHYGVDGFPYLLGLSASALALLGGGALGLLRGSRSRVSAVALVAGSALGVPTLMGLRYVMRGKLGLRERVLEAVAWRGGETVVDLGAGSGLLALGAARRNAATVHCVDLFVAKDLSGNTPGRLMRNAEVLGVADRVRLHRVDVRTTGLPDSCADVVLSSLCLHNLPDRAARAAALDEVVRLLRPGGTVVISDLAHVEHEYAPHLQRVGLTVARLERVPASFPPQRLLVALQPT